MGVVISASHRHLGGNIRHGDIHTWNPELWSYLTDRYGVTSVLDVGCGEGHAVMFFRRRGVAATGIDGLEDNVNRAVIPIAHHDLIGGPFVHQKPVDLVWSCEVAEHIPEEYVVNYIDTLCNGKIVAMTHAVPGQGGYHHVNCQPAEYWIAKMQAKGYYLSEDTDIFRQIAKDKEYTWTYFERTGLVFLKS